VIHFRGIPADTSEGEILQLGLPFGQMTNIVLAKKKNQVDIRPIIILDFIRPMLEFLQV